LQSELVFGTLTENRSSLEPCRHCPARRIIENGGTFAVDLRTGGGISTTLTSGVMRHNLLGSGIGSGACTYRACHNAACRAMAANPRLKTRPTRRVKPSHLARRGIG
jgi:hypothetical protein